MGAFDINAFKKFSKFYDVWRVRVCVNAPPCVKHMRALESTLFNGGLMGNISLTND